MDKGYIYILTNPAMPDWIKIGSTTNVDDRVKTLSSRTAVPLSFYCYATIFCENYEVVEKTIHDMIDAIDPTLRAKEKTKDDKEKVREFFRMQPSAALKIFKSVVKILNLPDTAIDIRAPSEEQIEVENVVYKKRKNTTFKMLDIAAGTDLYFLKDSTKSCRTANDINRVEYNGSISSISYLAASLLGSTSVNGFEWFSLEPDEKSLWDIRMDRENLDSEADVS